jgi:class 3 adenylate cyclase/tetratricopeptide (TPR) repeat protein
VPDCPSCGRGNPDDARFCSACGTALAVAEPAREQRKVVTVLFCDLVGSTALGESTDPEALRARMRRYFDGLRVILERHGGSVEKFVGDAVMAVFGIPTSHEDDALRAVRAAVEMRAAIAEHGLEARIGVNTGEVVVGGESETLVTGDAVNVAARLEQAAGSGQILIGSETRLLVRDAVDVEAVEPLELKGKSEPVEAFLLVDVIGDAEPLARHLDTPLVGRERERQRLWRDYEDAVADRTCRLFTLLGPAGIGKSRLVADFVERVGDSADVWRGRCLSYGEGITYWPLVEILIAMRVEPSSVIGSSPPETQLAFRKLLEARAAERAQVVVIDDLQWAETVFVDLVEHVADYSRDAPIFLLCIARTELLDTRPDWGGGKLNATSLLLEPLGAAECEELMQRLDARIDVSLRERITTASAGNPLYVEEMLAMVREHGGAGAIAVPPTIHALLQARIDSLDGDVRGVMERGAVEGEVFHRGSVAELSPPLVRDGVATHLATLVRKELIRSTNPTFPEDEGFRFRHLLIRDAAYASLPKTTRAELHERFADWLSGHELVERDEIVGYHLEQAHRYRAELDSADPRLDQLAVRAARRLAAGGQSALARGDYNAGRSLLKRAIALFPEGDSEGFGLVPDLAMVMWESGELSDATALLESATRADDSLVSAMATIVADIFDFATKGTLTTDERAARREQAHAALEAAGHHEGLALYWWSVAGEHWNGCRAGEAVVASEQGLVHTAQTGKLGRAEDLTWWICAAKVFGPTPVEEGIERLEALRVSVGDEILLQAGVAGSLGRLLAMRGDVDTGRELHLHARETFRDAGLRTSAAAAALARAWIEERAGQPEAAEAALRASFDELGRLSDLAFRSTVASVLAEFLFLRDQFDEARELCDFIRRDSPKDDRINFVYLHFLDGVLLAQEDRLTEAEEQGRRALTLAEKTDFFFVRARARFYLASTLARAGNAAESRSLAADGLALFSAKGDVTGRAWAERVLRDLSVTS